MEYFIKAAKIVKKQNKMTKFYIVGSGEDKQKLETLVKEKKMEDSIEFMGFRADIQNIMSQVDLIVLSSLWEGLPLTPMEAFSVGKTIVATSVDGTVEIVKDGENGYLVEPRNSEELANAICKLIDNEPIRKKFEINALQTYKNKFEFNIMKEKYIDFYKNIK